MGKLRLVSMESQCLDNIHVIPHKNKVSFVRRLAFSCGILTSLALLYLPTYHFAQRTFSGSGEIESVRKGSRNSVHLISHVVELKGWGYNTSRDLYAYILPQNVTTILNPVTLCIPPPFLLIIVCSAVSNWKARMGIRSTWGNKYNLDTLYNATVKIAFILGQSDNETINNSIAQESEMYSDIIQEKFHDTYNNLTLKSCMLLKWVNSNCTGIKYLMKVDDDMFINIPTFLQMLKSMPQSSGVLLGSLICNAKPISDPTNKWYTPQYMYSDRTYPNYLSGTGYVMSSDVASKLYDVALTTPLLHLEDVFITGLCAKKAKVRPVNHPGFSYIPRKMDPCVLKNVITAHKISVPNMYIMWNKLNNSSLICTNSAPNTKSIIYSNKNRGHFTIRRKSITRCV